MRELPQDSLLVALRASMPERPTGDCPSPETLRAASRGELGAGALEAVAQHVFTCEGCAEDLSASAALMAEADGQPGLAMRGGVRGRKFALAGLAALAAGLLLILLRSPSHRTENIRGSAIEDPVRSSPRQVSSAAQRKSGATLAWSAVEGAVRYEVRISTEGLELLDHASVAGRTTYPIPAPVAERGRGEPLLWQVEAVLAGGGKASSPTFHLQILPDAAPP